MISDDDDNNDEPISTLFGTPASADQKLTVHVAEPKTKNIKNKTGHPLYLDVVNFYKGKRNQIESIGYIVRYKKTEIAYIGGRPR